jgi:hypothetical protein
MKAFLPVPLGVLPKNSGMILWALSPKARCRQVPNTLGRSPVEGRACTGKSLFPSAGDF